MSDRLTRALREAVGAIPDVPAKKEEPKTPLRQWSVSGDVYKACGATVEHLPAGMYRLANDSQGQTIYQKMNLVSDRLIETPDLPCHAVMQGIRTFWRSREEYQKRQMLFKRGLLFWGPAGSGKTSLVTMIIREAVEAGAVILQVDFGTIWNVGRALPEIRSVEPDRPLMLVIEDIDTLTQTDSEVQSTVLQLLDGENQVDNIVNIATTNYPEKLDPRIANRPSRFDLVEKIGMPGEAARKAYLESVMLPEDLVSIDLATWVADTDGLALAHLRELIAAVMCMKMPYSEVIARLQRMKVQPKSGKEWGRAEVIGMAPGEV